MRQRRLLFLFLPAILAWTFANPLIVALGSLLPSDLGVAALLMPINILGQGMGFSFRFLIALFVFVLSLKAVAVLCGFGLPRAVKYSATKLLRRIQGIWAEVMIILISFLLVSVVFCIFG